jgi:hypothetical protein
MDVWRAKRADKPDRRLENLCRLHRTLCGSGAYAVAMRLRESPLLSSFFSAAPRLRVPNSEGPKRRKPAISWRAGISGAVRELEGLYAPTDSLSTNYPDGRKII